MDERESAGSRRRRQEQGARRLPSVGEEEGEQPRHEQLSRDGRRQRKGCKRATMPRRDPVQRDLRDHDPDPAPRGAKERTPRLVEEREGERRQHGRRVAPDGDRIDVREPRDQRQEPVPERKRVARMEAPVLELADVLERERAEDLELPDAGKVEERVAVEHGYMPESDPERNPGRDDADLGQLDATGSPPKSADP